MVANWCSIFSVVHLELPDNETSSDQLHFLYLQISARCLAKPAGLKQRTLQQVAACGQWLFNDVREI